MPLLKFLILLVLIFDMQIYVTFLIGSIRAEFTAKWFFSRMNHNMPFQTLRRAHFLLTIWATKTLGNKITWEILKSKILNLKEFEILFCKENKNKMCPFHFIDYAIYLCVYLHCSYDLKNKCKIGN